PQSPRIPDRTNPRLPRTPDRHESRIPNPESRSPHPDPRIPTATACDNDRMLTAAVRRAAALRQPRAAARIARALWTVWAIVVWNVVFDHVILVAGPEYIAAGSAPAGTSANPHPQYLAMDDWMRPAV